MVQGSSGVPIGRTWVKTLTVAEWKRVVFERRDRERLKTSLAAAESDVQRLRAVVKQLSPGHPVLRETFDAEDEDEDDEEGLGE